MNQEKKLYKKRINPYLYILTSFLLIITLGTILMMLPISTINREGLSFIDSLFMVTSSVCVTGLSVLENVGQTLSGFGKVIMAILIEIGGLSFLTIACFFYLLLGEKMGFSTKLMMREALNQSNMSNIVKLIKRIVIIALVIQLIGASLLFLVFFQYYEGNIIKAIGTSIFHSISSFCNAGLDIIGTNQSLVPLKDNLLFMIVTMALIILGGIGFVVIIEILTKKPTKYGLHTKIVLTMTISLLVLGTVLIKLISPSLTIMEALFTSVTCRTAGFTVLDLSTLDNGSVMTMIILMFIGASPCSTGGGIKTTTLFIILANIIGFARGKETVAFKRRISKDSILKAYVLVSLSVVYISFVTLLLCIDNEMLGMREVSFEAVSAFATVGLSLGITSSFTWFGKLMLVITMFIGRLGPLTITSLWNNNWVQSREEEIRYVKEDILVG